MAYGQITAVLLIEIADPSIEHPDQRERSKQRRSMFGRRSRAFCRTNAFVPRGLQSKRRKVVDTSLIANDVDQRIVKNHFLDAKLLQKQRPEVDIHLKTVSSYKDAA